MKKIALLALIALMMVGCSFKSGQDISEKIIILDSCEYIQYWSSDCSQSIEHKGNCKFCVERRKKELDSLAVKIWEGFE